MAVPRTLVRISIFHRPNVINGDQQSVMDAEINYAASAGLKYWAYCWYGQQTPASPMQNAWNLHQSSVVKGGMNWCSLLQFGRIGPFSLWNANIPTYISYFQQANYQPVLTNRPLVYLFIDRLDPLTHAWGGSWANVRRHSTRSARQRLAPGWVRPISSL